jgi:folate-binding protein YgfZ
MILASHQSPDDAALAEGAVVQIRPTSGLIVVSDADRSDFLHRMTTNNINALRPGQSAVTVLTTPTARIAFVFTVVCREEALWLLPSPGEATALARHLRGQIFFMDKVKVRDASADYRQWRVMGAGAATALAQLGFGLDDSPDGSWQEQESVLAVKQAAYDLPGFVLVAPAERDESVSAALAAAGVQPLADERYAAWRVELGRPAPGHELTGDYNPLEAGLAWACADNKGCYTGQEILARQQTYDKVTKTLVGLRPGAPVAEGSAVSVGGQTVGAVTSTALSPQLAAPVALAILKRPHNTPGTQVNVDGVAATVVELPFV